MSALQLHKYCERNNRWISLKLFLNGILLDLDIDWCCLDFCIYRQTGSTATQCSSWWASKPAVTNICSASPKGWYVHSPAYQLRFRKIKKLWTKSAYFYPGLFSRMCMGYNVTNTLFRKKIIFCNFFVAQTLISIPLYFYFICSQNAISGKTKYRFKVR